MNTVLSTLLLILLLIVNIVLLAKLIFDFINDIKFNKRIAMESKQLNDALLAKINDDFENNEEKIDEKQKIQCKRQTSKIKKDK